MKMKLMTSKKYLQEKFPRNVDLLVLETTADFTSNVIQSYAHFTSI